jgi:hypothetical protein
MRRAISGDFSLIIVRGSASKTRVGRRSAGELRLSTPLLDYARIRHALRLSYTQGGASNLSAKRDIARKKRWKETRAGYRGYRSGTHSTRSVRSVSRFFGGTGGQLLNTEPGTRGERTMPKRNIGIGTMITNNSPDLWVRLKERARMDRRTIRQTILLALTLFVYGRDPERFGP